MTTRAEAYLAAWAKTDGRTFDAAGRPVLTAEEAGLLRRAGHEDFIDAFRAVVGQEQARQRLAAIFAVGRRG